MKPESKNIITNTDESSTLARSACTAGYTAHNPSSDCLLAFLRESNAIEGVYDDFSLLKAQEAWKYLIAQDVLTVDVILKTHAILMAGKLRPEETGAFRKCHVWIGNRKGEHFNFVPKKMNEWVQTVMDMREYINPVGSHIIFERIHPFVDGNGRIGRMLLNWTRLKRTNEPLLVIWERERQEYYKWFTPKGNT